MRSLSIGEDGRRSEALLALTPGTRRAAAPAEPGPSVKVLVPATVKMRRRRFRDVAWVSFDPARPVPAEHADAAVLISRDIPAAVLAEDVRRLGGLRLVQALSADGDAEREAGFTAPIAAAPELHVPFAAEHALALVFELARRVNGQARSADEEHSRDGSADAEHTAGEPFSLVDARVAVWGMGPLGERVAALLTALGASVAGIGPAATERGGVQYFQEGTPMAARILERSALLVACVPGSEALIGGEAFDALGSRGLFVNVGAPATVDGDGLAVALAAGKLRGAALTGVAPLLAGGGPAKY